MKLIFGILFSLSLLTLDAQIVLTTAGRSFSNSEETWGGVNISRDVPTTLTFKNNTITSRNRAGYMLQAGDEGSDLTNNNLRGAVITGNKLNWTGNDMASITHGLFTGHNSDVMIKYNYLNYVPMGIIRKSSTNMSNKAGGVGYNIIKGGAVGMVVKGMSNVNIYNNTFYNDRTTTQTWRPLLHIYTNTDQNNYSVSHGTKIYNNIFYTKFETFAINIADNESLTGLECDYNVYWSESGSPKFMVNGAVKTFDEWKALGYDSHSVVVNPNFRDRVNFVPATRLDFGIDLGPEWKDGLSTNAVWGSADPATTPQNGKWQAGAVLHEGAGVIPPGEITIYPNPARIVFNIAKVNSSVTEVTIKMYDITGRLRSERTLDALYLQNIPVDVNPGIYFLKIELGAQGEHTTKLVVF